MMNLEAPQRKPIVSDEWHAPLLALIGLLFVWNLLGAWFSLNRGLGRIPTELQLQAVHFRVFFGSVAYALTALGLGVGRSRRGGSVALYGIVAVAAMMIGVVVLLSTIGVRTLG